MEEVVRSSRPDDPVAALHDARRQLFTARTARLVLRREPVAPPAAAGGRGLRARLTRTLAATGKAVEGEGILDLSRPGAAYDHGQFAVTEIGDSIWGGPSGRSLDNLVVDPNCRPGPLWFLGAVEFLNTVSAAGQEDVGETPCRRFQVSADLSVRADVRSAETSGAMQWSPAGLADRAAVTLTVWIDDLHLRRVSVPIGDSIHTLELSDVGANLSRFDWTRLSTFRTSVAEDIRGRENRA